LFWSGKILFGHITLELVPLRASNIKQNLYSKFVIPLMDLELVEVADLDYGTGPVINTHPCYTDLVIYIPYT